MKKMHFLFIDATEISTTSYLIFIDKTDFFHVAGVKETSIMYLLQRNIYYRGAFITTHKIKVKKADSKQLFT